MRRGLPLDAFGFAYNGFEVVVALAAAVAAGSVSPLGFAVDGVIEAVATGAAR